MRPLWYQWSTSAFSLALWEDTSRLRSTNSQQLEALSGEGTFVSEECVKGKEELQPGDEEKQEKKTSAQRLSGGESYLF